MKKYQRTLTIPSMSAEFLEKIKLSKKVEVNPYVLIRDGLFISGGGKQKMAVDRDGDTTRTWNGHIAFNLDLEFPMAQLLVFELTAGGKVIGKAVVEVKDLMGSIKGHLTYPIRTPSENRKGALNFHYKWKDEKVAGAVLSEAAMTSLTGRYAPPVMGPPPYGAAAAAGQYNPPFPPPIVMGPPPPGNAYGCGPYHPVQVQEQDVAAKKKKGGWFGRVIAAAAISEVLNNVSLDDLGF